MMIALASPSVALSLDDGLDKVNRFLSEASAQGREIVCFPEAYLPGLRGVGIDVLPFGQADHARVLQVVAQWARTYSVGTISAWKGSRRRAGRLPRMSLTPLARFRDTKPKTN